MKQQRVQGQASSLCGAWPAVGAMRRVHAELAHALQSHGASHAHLPPTIAAQKGTAGSCEPLVKMGHELGGQKKVAAAMPGQQA